jgi:hypothetical protein
MPHGDFLPRPLRIDALGCLHIPDFAADALARALQRLNRGRPRRKGRDPDGLPVEPKGPNTLSVGGAAPLEFDQE